MLLNLQNFLNKLTENSVHNAKGRRDKDRQAERQTSRWIDGWMDEWVGGEIDR